MFRRLFLEHPSSVGESYGQHANFAFTLGLRMVWAGMACILHGLLPFLFVKTGSSCIKEINECLEGRGNPKSVTSNLQAASTTNR